MGTAFTSEAYHHQMLWQEQEVLFKFKRKKQGKWLEKGVKNNFLIPVGHKW